MLRPRSQSMAVALHPVLLPLRLPAHLDTRSPTFQEAPRYPHLHGSTTLQHPFPPPASLARLVGQPRQEAQPCFHHTQTRPMSGVAAPVFLAVVLLPGVLLPGALDPATHLRLLHQQVAGIPLLLWCQLESAQHLWRHSLPSRMT